MNPDGPIVEEVRQRAMKISEQFGHDLHRYAEHLKQIAQTNRHRLVNQIRIVRAPESDHKQPDPGT